MYRHILIAAMAVCPLMASFAWQAEPPATTDGSGAAAKVRVLSAAQMSGEDAEVVAAQREAIASAAEVNGYDLGSGSWIRNQVVCPDAPRHVLMHYLKINQDGSLSLFTAAVPRSSGAASLRVRIIPVLYHGAPAFHVFGSSPSQRELMNEVVSAQQFARPLKHEQDWTELAYCYAALAGAEPTAKSVTAPEEITPMLAVSQEGDLRDMQFSVVGPEHVAQNWKVVFGRQAKVTAIILSAKPANDVQKAVPGTPAAAGAPPSPAAQASPARELSPVTQAPPATGVSPAIQVSPATQASPGAPASPATQVPPAIQAPPATQASPETQASPGTPPPTETPRSKGKKIPEGPAPKWRPIPAAKPAKAKPIPQPKQ